MKYEVKPVKMPVWRQRITDTVKIFHMVERDGEGGRKKERGRGRTQDN